LNSKRLKFTNFGISQIVMYKLSVGHAKIFCYFFASTAGF
jgi:hypothetical protein